MNERRGGRKGKSKFEMNEGNDGMIVSVSPRRDGWNGKSSDLFRKKLRAVFIPPSLQSCDLGTQFVSHDSIPLLRLLLKGLAQTSGASEFCFQELWISDHHPANGREKEEEDGDGRNSVGQAHPGCVEETDDLGSITLRI